MGKLKCKIGKSKKREIFRWFQTFAHHCTSAERKSFYEREFAAKNKTCMISYLWYVGSSKRVCRPLCGYKDHLAWPSSFIQAWDWHCQSTNSGGVVGTLE